jgi:S1-C subfamily serine protease
MQDYVEAYKWLNIAATSTNKPPAGIKMDDFSPEQREAFRSIMDKAREARESLAQKMTVEQIAQAQQLAREFRPRKEGSNSSILPDNPTASGTGFFITEDGYLVSNYHVVKEAAKVCLLTGAGLIDATVVKVDTANDLALLKAEGKFVSLPVASSRTAHLGGTVATVGFPNIACKVSRPSWPRAKLRRCRAAKTTRAIFKSVCRCSRAIRAVRW